MVDFDAALTAMHAACDGVFAKAATFRPAVGAAVDCRVEKFLPEAEFGFGDAKAVTHEARLRVTKAMLAGEPVAGDVFEFTGGESWRVLTAATTEDDDGLRWTLKVERVTP